MNAKITQMGKAFSILAVLLTSNMLHAQKDFSNEKSSMSLLVSYDMTWINITLTSNDVTLEDLASTYYADAKETEVIYNANRDVIPKSRKLHNGMKLKIPVTEKFRDQPEHLGWN